jgi:pimeloyl-ACP methyl ester carboxylesterase
MTEQFLPTQVLLPGMDGTGDLFAPLIAALGPQVGVKVIRYPADGAHGYAELESLVRTQLPPGPIVLLGESFSGPIAISIAASAPAGLQGLVLCCTFASNPRPVLSGMGKLIQMVPLSAMPTRLLSSALLGSYETSQLRAAFGAALAKVSPATMKARMRAVLSIDVRGCLRKVNVPILYMQARHDRVVPPSAGRDILRLKPTAGLMQFDAPHFLLQAAATSAARAVEEFVHKVKDPCVNT